MPVKIQFCRVRAAGNRTRSTRTRSVRTTGILRPVIFNGTVGYRRKQRRAVVLVTFETRYGSTLMKIEKQQ